MSSDKKNLRKTGKGTRAVHSGTSSSENSLNTPIFQSSTFFLDESAYKMWKEGKPRAPVYSRYNNPSLRAAENKIAHFQTKKIARKAFQALPEQLQMPIRRVVQKARTSRFEKQNTI